MIIGGAGDTYQKDQTLWFNVSDDSTVFEAAKPRFESVMKDNFIGWEKSGAAVDYMWTGSKPRAPREKPLEANMEMHSYWFHSRWPSIRWATSRQT